MSMLLVVYQSYCTGCNWCIGTWQNWC